MRACPPPVFPCPYRVDPLRGFIRPSLRQTGLKHLKISESLFGRETYVAIVQKGGADEAISGTYPVGHSEKHTSQARTQRAG